MPYRRTYNDRIYIQCDVCGKVHPHLFDDANYPPLPEGWGGGASHCRCPRCEADWPKLDQYGYGWKAGYPVPIIDHWTGQRRGPVFPAFEPPEKYPLGYFSSSHGGQIRYYSRKMKIIHLQFNIESDEKLLLRLGGDTRAPELRARIQRMKLELESLQAEIQREK
jgi:hypothetical protein